MPLACHALYAHVAREGRVVVTSASMALHRSHVRDVHGLAALVAGRDWIKSGDSAIAGPSGALLAGPLHAQEGILYAKVDLAGIAGSRWTTPDRGGRRPPEPSCSRGRCCSQGRRRARTRA